MPKIVSIMYGKRGNSFYSSRINLLGKTLPVFAFIAWCVAVFMIFMYSYMMGSYYGSESLFELSMEVRFFMETPYPLTLTFLSIFIMFVVIDMLTIRPLIFAEYDYELQDNHGAMNTFYSRYRTPVVGQCQLCGRAIPQFYGRRKQKFPMDSLKNHSLCFLTDQEHLSKYQELGMDDYRIIGEVGGALHMIDVTKKKAIIRQGVELVFITMSSLFIFLDTSVLFYIITILPITGMVVGQKGANLYPVLNRVYFNKADESLIEEIKASVNRTQRPPMMTGRMGQSFQKRGYIQQQVYRPPSPSLQQAPSYMSPPAATPAMDFNAIKQQTREYILRLPSLYDEIDFTNIEQKTGIDRTSLRELIEEMAFAGEISINITGSTMRFNK